MNPAASSYGRLMQHDQPFAIASPAGVNTRHIVNQILDCPFDGALARRYRSCKGMELLLEELDRHFVLRKLPHETTMNRKQVHKAWEILRENIEEPLSVHELAKAVGVSCSTLKRSFRKVYGTSVFAFFQDYRMDEARKMLESGDFSVTEVAFKVGYTNSGHFSRAFRRHFGVPPKSCVGSPIPLVS